MRPINTYTRWKSLRHSKAKVTVKGGSSVSRSLDYSHSTRCDYGHTTELWFCWQNPPNQVKSDESGTSLAVQRLRL